MKRCLQKLKIKKKSKTKGQSIYNVFLEPFFGVHHSPVSQNWYACMSSNVSHWLREVTPRLTVFLRSLFFIPLLSIVKHDLHDSCLITQISCCLYVVNCICYDWSRLPLLELSGFTVGRRPPPILSSGLGKSIKSLNQYIRTMLIFPAGLTWKQYLSSKFLSSVSLVKKVWLATVLSAPQELLRDSCLRWQRWLNGGRSRCELNRQNALVALTRCSRLNFNLDSQ